MKCISCEIEIDPKWRHAIDQNVCPFCGQSIVEELLKSLLSILQDTMQKLQEYPEQLNDWLLANFDYIKTTSPNIKDYVPPEILKEMKKEYDAEDFDRKKRKIKVKIDENGKEVEVMAEKIQSDSKTAGFLVRAGLITDKNNDDGESDMDSGDEPSANSGSISLKPTKQKTFKNQAERNAHFKKLKEKIEKEAGGQENTLLIDPDVEPVDPEDLASLIDDSSSNVHSSIIGAGSNDIEDDSTTRRILSINLSMAKNKDPKMQNGGYNAKDAEALESMVQRAKNTGMGGGFSRRE